MLTDVRRCHRRARVVTGVWALAVTSTVAAAQAPPSPTTGEATFNVFIRSTPAGLERTRVTQTTDGWLIQSRGQVSAPINLETRLFEAAYDANWRPQRLTVQGTRGGTSFALRTTFAGGTAMNELREGTVLSTNEEPIDPTAVVLPNLQFAAYEALAVRLSASQQGDQLPIYVAPRGHITAHVTSIDAQQVQTAERTLTATIYRVTFNNPGEPLDAEVWVDEGRRLLRLSLPSASLEIARQDLVSVSTRLTGDPHPGDEEVRVQSAGFSLAATVTTPVDHEAPQDGRWPAVLLVPGSGPVDRDENVFGVAIFRQLAGALADAGFLVARYDKRGVGQSGGRSESASLRDYADDAREMVRYLERRGDVDRDRVVVVGHSEGGWVGLIATGRERKIKALALLAAPGTTGEALVLEQQRTELDRLGAPESERREKVALQERIHAAVIGDATWDDIPAQIRPQADTAWFRSFLEFAPGDVMRRVRQPLLILQGELDQQVLPHHADRLEAMARERRRREATVEVVKLSGINHLLVPATTGTVAEYATLLDKQITPRVAEALVDWIRRVLP